LTLQAECHNAQGDRPAARKLLDEALQLAPDHLGAMRLRAMMDIEGGDAESAVRVLRQAIEFHPKAWRLRFQLVRAYRQAGQQELAQEQAEIMQGLRRLRDRFTELHDQAMADPADVETRYQLGLVARQLDMPGLAYDWFMVTLAMDPEHAGAREALEAMMREAPSPQEGAASRR
jgi:tetratricopeptide (TPR) repeat protein